MAKKSKKDDVMAAVPSPVNDDYEVRNHADNLLRAHQFMADPKNAKKLHKHIKAQREVMRSLEDVTKYRNEKYGPKKDMAAELEEEAGEKE